MTEAAQGQPKLPPSQHPLQSNELQFVIAAGLSGPLLGRLEEQAVSGIFIFSRERDHGHAWPWQAGRLSVGGLCGGQEPGESVLQSPAESCTPSYPGLGLRMCFGPPTPWAGGTKWELPDPPGQAPRGRGYHL